MDFKKTILWAVFSLSGLMLYNNWQVHEGKPSMFGGAPVAAPAANDKAIAGNKVDVPSQIAGSTATTATPTTNVGSIEGAEKFVLQNDVLVLEVSASGANIVDAKLLKALTAEQKPVELFQYTPTHKYFARSGLITLNNSDLPNHTSVFKLVQSGKDGSGRPYLVLASERSGVKLEKTFILNPGSYVVEVGHRVSQAFANTNPLVLYTEIVRDGMQEQKIGPFGGAFSASTFTGPAAYTDKEKFNKLEFTAIDKNKITIPTQVPAGDPAWIAMVQHYFASAWIPGDKAARDIYAGRIDNGLYRIGMQTPLGVVVPGSVVVEKAQLFVGPQEEKVLETIAPGFELLKDYGYLTILAKPIFWLLEKIHGYVGNWGWSIILLTILIKLVFFPLSAASYKSMARMKEVQPRLMAMKEQYKGEPQKLNQAMMEMYRKEKINPLGGCLPVVIQIPVFISLYWVLLSSVEMRGAPWILWIHDLSVPDPFYILPVIMAVSMFAQTKLNPTPPDPIQAKVMMYMPIVFSIMFFFFPAGLVLYWVVNNLLSIAQQWQINKMFGKKTAK
ncbi:membrane protein insertase YidC [Polynucleobacter wuianus]|uniref:Membrane protein insertase YidC n=1 Tax=Polynucleobacter wuianus TaxID=1743168 RepID=A0A191UHZ8_9BURK|nr:MULTISPECIES: membrane protein insertase YidC [Polynucleobacter]ANJ00634.1 membrane protein insertase YidC [Polynucleobacter wuianus]MBU3553788.1 membrane protein insertase YidC [Polynucleobacter sp. MWH-Post4-6-1]